MNVWTFFALTYLVTSSCFVGARQGGALQTPLLLLGTVAPSLVALLLTARDEGLSGVRALVSPVFRFDVGVRWYIFAVSYFLIVKLTAAAVQRLFLGAWPQFGAEPFALIVLAIPFSTPVQAGEEIGWRGYALPRLASRFGWAWASIVIGVVWAVWHLPLFFIPDVGDYGQSFPAFAVGTVALSVAITYVYARTGGSLLLTMLMHSAINQTTFVVVSRVAIAGSAWS